MDNEVNQPVATATTWKPGQTYAMAVICLVIGLAVGYLLRGSAAHTAPATVVAAAAPAPTAADPHAGMGQQAMPTLDDMKRMADKQAAPLLSKLKDNPKDVAVLNRTALTYKAAHQFKEAIVYFQKALDIDPKNVAIRDDMASCMYFTGDVDGALTQLHKSLSYDPKHPGTLMNIGIIEWQGKKNVDGAITTWEKLLKLNPNFPQKAVVEHLIAEARQQQNPAQALSQPKG